MKYFFQKCSCQQFLKIHFKNLKSQNMRQIFLGALDHEIVSWLFEVYQRS